MRHLPMGRSGRDLPRPGSRVPCRVPDLAYPDLACPVTLISLIHGYGFHRGLDFPLLPCDRVAVVTLSEFSVLRPNRVVWASLSKGV